MRLRASFAAIKSVISACAPQFALQEHPNTKMEIKVRELFRETFGADPVTVSRAPGIIEVLGNHTDYNEGLAISCAIDLSLYAAAAQSPDNETFEFVSDRFPEKVSFGDAGRQVEEWARYPLGVYSVMKQGGYPVRPFRLAICSNIPGGQGLSSSTALEAASAMCICSMFGIRIGRTDLAKICHRARNYFANSNGGMLEHLSVFHGKKDHFLTIDFQTLSCKALPFTSLDISLAAAFSGVSRPPDGAEYGIRRKQCVFAADYFSEIDPNVKTLRDVDMDMLTKQEGVLDKEIASRVRHIIGENDRVLAGIRFLTQGDWASFGRTLNKSHESSRLNFENSRDELDALVLAARAIDGVYGARLTGQGFGGSMIAAFNSSVKDAFIKGMASGDCAPGFRIEARIVLPSDGACDINREGNP
jgi:galactokinase